MNSARIISRCKSILGEELDETGCSAVTSLGYKKGRGLLLAVAAEGFCFRLVLALVGPRCPQEPARPRLNRKRFGCWYNRFRAQFEPGLPPGLNAAVEQ